MGFSNLFNIATGSPVGSLTNLFGSNGFNSAAQWGLKPGDNVGSNFGNSLNEWTGASASARQQFQHNMALQHDAQEFAKWQMYNSHQAEVQDLINAGLNPVLSAGGQGATAGGVSANGTGAGISNDPASMVAGIFNMLNSAKQTKATVDKLEADIHNETRKTTADINNQTDLTKAQIRNLDANTGETNYNTGLNKDLGINANTPREIKLIKAIKNSARKEREDWKEKGKLPGFTGWKYRMRTRIAG